MISVFVCVCDFLLLFGFIVTSCDLILLIYVYVHLLLLFSPKH